MLAKSSPVFHIQDPKTLAFHAGPGEILKPIPDVVCPAHRERAEVLGNVIRRLDLVAAYAVARGLNADVVKGARARLVVVRDLMTAEVAAMDFCIASGDVAGGQHTAYQVVEKLPVHRCTLDGIVVSIRGAARTYGPDQSDIWMGLLGCASVLAD